MRSLPALVLVALLFTRCMLSVQTSAAASTCTTHEAKLVPRNLSTFTFIKDSDVTRDKCCELCIQNRKACIIWYWFKVGTVASCMLAAVNRTTLYDYTFVWTVGVPPPETTTTAEVTTTTKTTRLTTARVYTRRPVIHTTRTSYHNPTTVPVVLPSATEKEGLSNTVVYILLVIFGMMLVGALIVVGVYGMHSKRTKRKHHHKGHKHRHEEPKSITATSTL